MDKSDSESGSAFRLSIVLKASVNQPQQKVLDALELYLPEKSLEKRQQPLDASQFKIQTVANLPQQDYDYGSGIFSCMFAEYVLISPSLSGK